MMVEQQQAAGANDAEQDQLIVARVFHGIVIATPQRDSLWDRVKIHQVHDKLVKYLAAKQPPALILDLEKVEIVSSEALSILLRIRDHAVARNLQLRLCNLQHAVREVMRITELAKLFEIYDTLPQAYRGLLPED
jgi:anti-anti-sigma factor